MILTINCGSSTIKYQLFTTDVKTVVAKGIVSRIGEDGSYFEQRTDAHNVKQARVAPSHHQAFELCIENLLHPEWGAIDDLQEIEAVGHRAVHGADLFVESTRIDAEVIDKLEQCVPLAPLHNPANLIGIREAQSLLPHVPHVAVFDTSFNQTMPARAYTYALPYRFYTDHKIRKYGFHGTSVRYVSGRAATVLARPLTDLKMVVCHLGNGVTMTAVSGGQAVDTTIGFATFSGVMMGTRSGDIDPGLIFHLHRDVGMPIAAIEKILYKESGLLGISGVSNDMREVEQAAADGNARCRLALDVYAYMAKKYVGAFAAAMGGINALVFTAGIGENSVLMRQMICAEMAFLGIRIDSKRNEAMTRGAEGVISADGAETAVLVIPTNEERMIALDTVRLAAL